MDDIDYPLLVNAHDAESLSGDFLKASGRQSAAETEDRHVLIFQGERLKSHVAADLLFIEAL